jgi:hypothetical protein
MSSDAPPDRLPLDRDLPATAEDVAALRRLRRLPPLDTAAYLAFLLSLTPASTEALRARAAPSGRPFELRDP